MNLVTWASMQSPDVLESVDRMIPDLVSERDWEAFRRKKLRNRRGHGTSRQQPLTWRHVLGTILVFIGILMLFPGPSDIAVAGVGFTAGAVLGYGILGSLALGAAFVVATYVLAFAMIAVGAWLLAS